MGYRIAIGTVGSGLWVSYNSGGKFRHIGAKVGIYSTASQWNPIVGTVRPGSPLYRLPDWRPGAKALAQAKKNCHLAPLTGGGTVTVTQWKTPSANSDFSCPAPPAKAKVKRS